MLLNLVFLATIALAAGQTSLFLDGTPLGLQAIMPLSTVDPISLCNGQQTKPTFCDDTDVCIAKGIISCPAPSKISTAIVCPTDKPHCNVDAILGDYCSATVDPIFNCPIILPEPAFKCTSPGFFPDPNNCLQYFYCELNEAGDMADPLIFGCPAGYVYYHLANNCKRQFLTNECILIQCKDSDLGKFVQYGSSNSTYALCQKDAPTDTVFNPTMFRCGEKETVNMSAFPPTCTFPCKTEGSFKKTENTYYNCIISGGILKAVVKTCPGPTKFVENANAALSTCQ